MSVISTPQRGQVTLGVFSSFPAQRRPPALSLNSRLPVNVLRITGFQHRALSHGADGAKQFFGAGRLDVADG
jgi:hypothetical protein